MFDESAIRDSLDAVQSDDRWGVLLVALAVAVLGVGYAAGSVLAGERLADQTWLVPVVGLPAALFAVLATRTA